MNIKILKHARDNGFCCLWAYLEANKQKYTSVMLKELEGKCTVRALQYQRASHRAGLTQCEGLEACLKKRIKEGHMIS